MTEFLVAILSGAKYLQDISLAAHPLDKDVAVAQAWGQPGWADYTGVSRTLKKLTWTEVNALVEVLERVSQPMLENELALLRAQGRGLEYDGDLTGLPVSNTSRTYPNAAYGHMSDEIRLGYQARPDQPAKPELWTLVDIGRSSCWRYRLLHTSRSACAGSRKAQWAATETAD